MPIAPLRRSASPWARPRWCRTPRWKPRWAKPTGVCTRPAKAGRSAQREVVRSRAAGGTGRWTRPAPRTSPPNRSGALAAVHRRRRGVVAGADRPDAAGDADRAVPAADGRVLVARLAALASLAAPVGPGDRAVGARAQHFAARALDGAGPGHAVDGRHDLVVPRARLVAVAAGRAGGAAVAA